MSVRKLLEPAQEAYKVPFYQRPYAWQEEQWQDLIDDVKGLTANQDLFLGSIVLVPEEHRPGVNYYEVVDGQQRLATLLIWFSAIRDSENEKDNTSFADHINKTFLFSRELDGKMEKLIPKLALIDQDNNTFIRILKHEDNTQENLITECYSFFKKNACDSTLLDTLLDKVHIIHINAKSHFNAFRLFETLNDRGLELSALDLIKNFILMRLKSLNAQEETIDQTIQNWNEMYQKIGSNEHVKFLRRYTMSRYQGKIAETKLYETTKAKVQDFTVDQTVDFVKDINSKASIYKKIIERGFSSPEINLALSHLAMVQVGPSYTLLMKLFSLFEDGKIQKKQIIEIMRLIETFHIRWGICGKATAALDQIYNDLSNDIKPDDIVQSISLVRERFTKELKTGADNITFETSFKTKPFKSSELRTKYILWQLSAPTGETIPDLNIIETEHIMPQKLSNEWYHYLFQRTGKNEEEIRLMWEENLNRIGNLTIMKGEWNIRDSNKLFEVKKNDYSNSEFATTSDLTSLDAWDFGKIEERSNMLAKKALERWSWKF